MLMQAILQDFSVIVPAVHKLTSIPVFTLKEFCHGDFQIFWSKLPQTSAFVVHEIFKEP